MHDVLIVGAGHNGLVCGTILARAGLDVLIVEANEEAGGCIWTETLPTGHRLERGAIDHGQVLSTADDLGLAALGLEYQTRDAVAGAGFADGTSFVFDSDLESSIDKLGVPEGDRSGYRRLSQLASSLFAMMDTFQKPPMLSQLSEFGSSAGTDPVRLLMMSAEKLVGSYIDDRHLRSAIAMYGAHAQLPPWIPGTGLFGMLLPGSHGNPPSRPVGGSAALVDALQSAFKATGGRLVTGARVDTIRSGGDGVRVRTQQGGSFGARAVVSTLDIGVTSRLIDPLPDSLRLAANSVTSGALNVAELKVDLALDEPASPGPWSSPEALWLLQEHPDSLRKSFADIVAGRLPSEGAMMWASPSALDETAAPKGQGTVWLSAFVPARGDEISWDGAAEASAGEWLLDGYARITGTDLRPSIVDMRVSGPATWQQRIGARFGNPNHIDLTIDQLFNWRPPTGQTYRTELPWLYLSGAGTHPGGGLSGIPGRNAADAVLSDLSEGRRRGTGWVNDLRALRQGWDLFRTLRGPN